MQWEKGIWFKLLVCHWARWQSNAVETGIYFHLSTHTLCGILFEQNPPMYQNKCEKKWQRAIIGTYYLSWNWKLNALLDEDLQFNNKCIGLLCALLFDLTIKKTMASSIYV